MWISNFLRLGKVVLCYAFTQHSLLFAYMSFYHNWLISNPNLQFGIMNISAKVPSVKSSSFILNFIDHPAYITYRSFYYKWLMFNHIL